MVNLSGLVLSALLSTASPSDSVKINSSYSQDQIKSSDMGKEFKLGDTVISHLAFSEENSIDISYILVIKGIVQKREIAAPWWAKYPGVDSSNATKWYEWYIDVFDSIPDSEKKILEEITRKELRTNKPIYFDVNLLK